MILKALFNFYKKGICVIKALFGKVYSLNVLPKGISARVWFCLVDVEPLLNRKRKPDADSWTPPF
jgi:hypothetical protein